ncbi:MAG: hypothetical protein CML04_01965 [Pseudozobellia sp.]|nr:hypothetical protein [Pseudozobellia sp.]MBG48948.1 hypothetical protein [Pseudozobellia sp.]|tara:strand:+ start:329438 stop:329944 length:507 start_codon:yes stop_codon:yes gene_type:complete
MKTFILSSKFLLLSFLSIQLALCSNDDDSVPSPEEESFEPVTLSLVGLDIDLEDTSFSVDGFDFSAYRAKSYEDSPGYGILLAFPQDGNRSWIELDLSNTVGLSKITASVSDYGGGTTVVIMSNGEVVEEAKDIPDDPSDIAFNLNGRAVDALRITSLEGDVNSIKLE